MAMPSQRFSLTWVLNLFGTAVGAGVLFLPINAGMGGFYPLIIMTLLVGPMTYLAHRGLTRFVLSSKYKGSDITAVVREHFGEQAGKLITLLYFFAIFPILLIYGVGITNTVSSFMENQLHIAPPSRAVLSFMLIAAMIGVMLLSEQVMLKITTCLVYPLVLILLGLSIYLIPQWNTAALQQMPTTGDFLTTLWLTIPVLVFAFNHSPAISSFALSQQKYYQDDKKAEIESAKVLRSTAFILVLFVMFFVFSCVLTLTPEELAQAKVQNISILSYLANKFDNPIISYFGPLVAFLAIGSSFFGHYLGAREGLEGLVNQMRKEPIDPSKFRKITAITFLIILWIVATINPSILGFIESLGGPIIAMILFIMPVYAVVPALARFKGEFGHLFVLVMGCIAISAIVYGLL
ncbi:aromatic amino acid transport family protein [Mannheimia haemolytica]|uniref:aromatic amino acid transport family protein n=1 Tax=Mannheimia haemolytica TaxID=75985 RepID=UPI0003863855|nr:aromatic amino acid transport family protein [Mannheimia haemolytica]EPZ00903.1 septum formation initiator [Mannheimia haemolytica D35]MDW1150402.1 aromatic amino acid transport family protein [Mannheimia haemolytica]MDW1159024.1 aromatic amino acid transport family protein [Mannheimia haemolytica]NBB66326.1 serine transporter [Mannheimia haemolytica]TRC46479.1 HAAAP family serine/threonine permease [Mannheimia haemolytica]